jgi:hypothetical protein
MGVTNNHNFTKWYRNSPFQSRQIAVIDIKCLIQEKQKNQIANQGWTVLPIFHESSLHKFVKAGLHQMPLVGGIITFIHIRIA